MIQSPLLSDMTRHTNFPHLYRAISTSAVEAFRVTNPLINIILHLLCLPSVLELTRLGIKMEGIIALEC